MAWAGWGLHMGFVGEGFCLNGIGPVTRRQRIAFWALATVFSTVFAAGVIVVLCGLVTVYRWETR
jgi:hypothetical protein